MYSRLGPIELATVGQGIQLVGVTTTVLILSSTAAQTTLSAPLFTSKSASAKKEIGIMAQRGFILAHICVIPMAFVWWFIKPIMIALGQPESLANGLQSFLRWNLLSIPGYGGLPF
jgi:MATE family multidrug resistance protein